MLHFLRLLSEHAFLAASLLSVGLQVMAPLLDHNHELNWQANMVKAIEKRQSTQHTEGSLLAPPSPSILPD